MHDGCHLLSAYCGDIGYRAECAVACLSCPFMLPAHGCMPRHFSRLKFVLLAASTAVLLVGCDTSGPASASPGRQAASDSDAAAFHRFDTLVTPEAIFPDPAQRALYVMHAPASDNGGRSHVFELKAQPGMVANHHFPLIAIAWARAGRFVGNDGAARGGSTGGPGGTIVDAVAQTADKAWDVRVSEAMLLPETAKVPEFDLPGTVTRLVQRYGAQASRR